MQFLFVALRFLCLCLLIVRIWVIFVEWAREIEREIREADAVIPLLSAHSIHSEMIAFEVEHAHETAPGAVGGHSRSDSICALGGGIQR